jgi:DnaJ-class molecular chaperone
MPKLPTYGAILCPDCGGMGGKINQEPSALYGCGFKTVFAPCSTCFGVGRYVTEVVDRKMVASGDAR